MIIVCLVGMGGTAFISMQPRVVAYTPSIGNLTDYNYGFVSIQPNLTATQIYHWTGLNLSIGNYTLHWQQHVNLTISVLNIVQVGPLLEAFYNFSYMPILIDPDRFGLNRDQVYTCLRAEGILARKYFYPLTSGYSFYRNLPSAGKANLPVSHRVTE